MNSAVKYINPLLPYRLEGEPELLELPSDEILCQIRIQVADHAMLRAALFEVAIAPEGEEEVVFFLRFEDQIDPFGRGGDVYFQSIHPPIYITRDESAEFPGAPESVVRMRDGKHGMVFSGNFATKFDTRLVGWEVIDGSDMRKVAGF